jgi:hypothetical protein
MPDLDTVAPPARVTIVDINMPFGSMVAFIIKWTLAAIPAMVILAILGFTLATMFASLSLSQRGETQFKSGDLPLVLCNDGSYTSSIDPALACTGNGGIKQRMR